MKMITIVTLLLLTPLLSFGFSESRASNPLLAEKPVFFAGDGLGGFYGYTETGTPFTQRVIRNDFSVRLHKFTIADISFYVSERGIIEAASDTAALSIYFSRA